MAGEWWQSDTAAEESTPRLVVPKPRRWLGRFRESVRGVKLGVRGHSSFCVHFFFTVLAMAAALALQCDWQDWCLIVGCIGLVLTAELFKSAIEKLVRGLDDATQVRIRGCLDISAGAVLVARMTAVAMGMLVFGRQILILMGRLEP